MVKKFYLKVNKDNIVTDALSFPYEGYVEYETDELPAGAFSGWFKLENGMLVEYPELKPPEQPNPNDEMMELKRQVAEQEQAIMELTALLSGGGANV